MMLKTVALQLVGLGIASIVAGMVALGTVNWFAVVFFSAAFVAGVIFALLRVRGDETLRPSNLNVAQWVLWLLWVIGSGVYFYHRALAGGVLIESPLFAWALAVVALMYLLLTGVLIAAGGYKRLRSASKGT
jgi:hypothetical protein